MRRPPGTRPIWTSPFCVLTPLSVRGFSIHISVQIPHQDGMLPLVSTMPLHNLHFLLSESIYRQQHVCSSLVTPGELQGLSGQSGGESDVAGSFSITKCTKRCT